VPCLTISPTTAQICRREMAAQYQLCLNLCPGLPNRAVGGPAVPDHITHHRSIYRWEVAAQYQLCLELCPGLPDSRSIPLPLQHHKHAGRAVQMHDCPPPGCSLLMCSAPPAPPRCPVEHNVRSSRPSTHVGLQRQQFCLLHKPFPPPDGF